jgi:atypical dual specificity phosphatase
LPVADLAPPAPQQFMQALEFIDPQRLLGRAVVVHCLMGQGRTGSVLAAHLNRHGLPAHEAVSEIRALCPGAIGTPEQERALLAFAARRDWLI